MFIDNQPRISLTTWPHRHVFRASGGIDQCLYCSCARPRSRTARDLALLGAGLAFVAVLSVIARLA